MLSSAVYLTYPSTESFTVTDSQGFAPYSTCRQGLRMTSWFDVQKV